MLVNKPPGVPAHATVDNFGENMLAGLRQEPRLDRGFAAQVDVVLMIDVVVVAVAVADEAATRLQPCVLL